MYERKDVFVRCSMFLLAGFLVSFSILTAFGDMIRVPGAKRTFVAGTMDYANGAELTYLNNITLSAHILVENLSSHNSSDSPAGHLGALPMLYKQNANGTYTVAEAGVWEYSRNATYIYSNSVSITYPPNGYFVARGKSAVYFKGGYVITDAYASPFIKVG